MKKNRILKITAIVITLLILSAYAGGCLFFRNHFLPQTTINGLDVSLSESEEANRFLSEIETPIRVLQHSYDGSAVEETILLNDLFTEPLQYHTEGVLSSQNPFLWFTSFFQQSELQCSDVSGNYDEKKLQDAVSHLFCMQETNIVEPENARIELVDSEPTIIKENDGCKIDSQDVIREIRNVVDGFMNGNNELTADLNGLYQKATVTQDNPDLLKALKELQAIGNKKIQITISDKKSETLEGADLKNLLKLDEQSYLVNEEALDSYASSLTGRYNVSKYEYIDRTKLKNDLSAALLKSEDSTIKASWVKETKKYVEVSISQQTLWYYENDELIFSSPVVTGNADMGSGTPTGTYYVRRKVTDSILRGSDYTEHVDYWIGWDSTGRIYGFHDASWRSDFGGDIYLSDPSHGCVNMPTDMVAKLYNAVDIGTEVYIHK